MHGLLHAINRDLAGHWHTGQQANKPISNSSPSPSTPFVSPPQSPLRDRSSKIMPTPMAGSTRWCPTPEQLMILEEMYRGGLRTPNASQIQQITAHLAHYGRIEGKNVFYWFQNHKARDRQKLRRRLCMSHHLLSCAHYYAHQHHLLGAALPTAAQYYSSPGLDQQYSGTPAAAYSAGYGYPLGGAAPASRCAGAPNNPLFPSYQGASVLPEYSLGRLGNFGVAEDACPASTTAGTPMTEDQAMSAPPFCRPLKTLDLFPGALKEEQRDVV